MKSSFIIHHFNYLQACTIMLQVVPQKIEHQDFKVLIGAGIPDPVPFIWVDLELVGLLGLDQGVDQHLGVLEVDILIDQPMDDEETVLTKGRTLGEPKPNICHNNMRKIDSYRFGNWSMYVRTDPLAYPSGLFCGVDMYFSV